MDSQSANQPTISTAVILAAGLGSRLNGVNGGKPKGLLSLGGCVPVERSIHLLQSFGIERLILVTGYQAQEYEKLAAGNPAIATVYNPDFADSGSMASLYCARQLLTQMVPTDSFLLLDGDLVYEKRALEALLQDRRPAGLLISGFTHNGDEYFVEATDDFTFRRFSKERSALSNVAGEWVGITKISAELWAAMRASAETHFQRSLQWGYEPCLQSVAHRVAVPLVKMDDLLWCEIDDAAQLRRVREEIWPQIRAKELAINHGRENRE
ncbi:MAG: phosphocholine cytidylyltransferase family protein [Caldilineaceae bacterium]|nr:phosphocholine cytidylyltransferase family protein [Caldilineaceae bacterium]